MLLAAGGLEAYASSDYSGNVKSLHNQGRARDLIPPLRQPNPALLAPAFAPSNPSDSKAIPCTTTSYPFILDYRDSLEGAPKLGQNRFLQGFREFQAARRTIKGYEAVHMIRKAGSMGAGDNLLRQIRFIDCLFDLAT